MRLSAGHYFGEKRSQVRFGDLILSELTYTERSAFPKHSHENAYMIFVLHGTQMEDFRGGRHRYERGVLALHPAEETHRHEIGTEGLSCLNVEFGTDWLAANPHALRGLQKPAHLDTNRFPTMALMAGAIYTEFHDLDDVSLLAIEGCLLSLLAEITRSNLLSATAKPDWLMKARDTLHDCYSKPLSLKTLGTLLGVHPVHLAREFHKHYRCTVAEYIRRLRIHSACEAIRRSEASFSQIALNSGFADQAHFTRTFKKVIGMTPGQFRVRNDPR
jgi:AraC family transcriptional regulator